MYLCTTNLSLGNEQQSVKAVEELRGGLVDAGDDGLPFLVSQLLQSSEEGEGSSAVQSWSGLLEQEGGEGGGRLGMYYL